MPKAYAASLREYSSFSTSGIIVGVTTLVYDLTMNAIACSALAFKGGIMDSHVKDCESQNEVHQKQGGRSLW